MRESKGSLVLARVFYRCSVRASRSALSGMCPVYTNLSRPLPPGFSQVFILKELKVLCFDTLLQVFILKGLPGTCFSPTIYGKQSPEFLRFRGTGGRPIFTSLA